MASHTTARLIRAGRGILCTEDGLCVFTAHGPDLDANEARLIAIWSSHDQIVAENVTLREDLNDARSNWEAAAEELRQADAVREQLVAALKGLLKTQPNANDGMAGGHQSVTAEDVEACRQARAALTAAGAAPLPAQPGQSNNAGLMQALDICEAVIHEADQNCESAEESGARRCRDAIQRALAAGVTP